MSGRRAVRAVVDTNVVIQGVLNQTGPGGLVLGLVVNRMLTLLVDERILDEYEEVMSRPKFGFAATDVAVVMKRLRQVCEVVQPYALPGGKKGMPDPKDIPFAEVAVAGRAQVLITENVRDYPLERMGTVDVLTAAQFASQCVSIVPTKQRRAQHR